MSKVLFLDIDGVLLPGRAYGLPNQTRNPYVTVFDPCAVAMLNDALRKQDRKIVVHSSWVKHWEAKDIRKHLADQNVNVKFLHDDWMTSPDLAWRYDRVGEWLHRHPEVTDFVILDDEPETRASEPEGQYTASKNLILTDFDEGITMAIYRRILDGTFPRK